MNVTQDARTGRMTLNAGRDEGLVVDDSTNPVWSRATLDHSDALALAGNLTEQHPGLHLFSATGAMSLDRDEVNVQYDGTSSEHPGTRLHQTRRFVGDSEGGQVPALEVGTTWHQGWAHVVVSVAPTGCVLVESLDWEAGWDEARALALAASACDALMLCTVARRRVVSAIAGVTV